MKKIVIAIALTLALGGCAQLKTVGDVLSISTMEVSNPITPEMLYQAENGMIVIVSGLNAYKRACVQKVIPRSCREVIAKIQVYTRQVPPLLRSARAFVRDNDQVNARVVYNTLTQLLADARAIAMANNVETK